MGPTRAALILLFGPLCLIVLLCFYFGAQYAKSVWLHRDEHGQDGHDADLNMVERGRSPVVDEQRQAAIDEILQKEPFNMHMSVRSDHNEHCAVCLEAFSTKQDVTSTSFCRHVYHRACITNWLLQNNDCPVCRTEYLK